MGTHAIIGVVESDETGAWHGVYVAYDGDVESAGHTLVGLINEARGELAPAVDKLITRAPAGWEAVGGRKWTSRKSPFPNGVRPDQVGEVDPYCVYLFDVKARRFLVFQCGTFDPGMHRWRGLGDFELIASVSTATTIDPASIRERTAKNVVSRLRVATGWEGSSMLREEARERRILAELIADEARRQGADEASWRERCRRDLAEMLLGLGWAGTPTPLFVSPGALPSTILRNVKLGTLEVRYETGFWQPAPVSRLLDPSGAEKVLDEPEHLAGLAERWPILHMVARLLVGKKTYWLGPMLDWIRRGDVEDPMPGDFPRTELRHPDGRRWAITLTDTHLTLEITDSEGDTFSRSRTAPSSEEAAKVREELIAEMRADGFA